MDNRNNKHRDAEPFVQAVHLVESAQPRLRPARPQGQDHRNAHATDCENAGHLHHRSAKRKERGGLKYGRFRNQPQHHQNH